jgi:sugar lactone lactonase YvrE
VVCDGLTVTYGNEIYFSDAKDHQVWFIDANQQKRVVDAGIASPLGLRLTPDQGFLNVSDPTDQFIYSLQVLPNGSLTNRQRLFDLHVADGVAGSGAGAMTTDANGWLYATTGLGIQVCDEPGRVEGIIAAPTRGELGGVLFGGAGMDEIFVATGDTVFKRKVKVKGLEGCELPFKLPNPHL